MSREITLPISFDEIDIQEGRREVNPAVVKRLADSIEQVGLRHPITVRKKNDRYELIAGRHRLEACRKLGRESVTATIVQMSKDEARLWEIAENLHRADLNNIEKAEQIEEWRAITARRKVANGLPPGGRQPEEAGIRQTAEALGVSRPTVANAKSIAAISDDAKQAALDAGITGVRDLVAVAKAPPDRQAAVVHDLAERRSSQIDRDVKDRAAHAVAELLAEHIPGPTWDALKANLYAAGAANIANALTNITGEAIMDRRFGE